MDEELKIPEMCDGCPACAPEDYSIEINMLDLQMIQRALINLEKYAKIHSAPGWLQVLEDKMRECIKKYNLKEEDFSIFGEKLLKTEDTRRILS